MTSLIPNKASQNRTPVVSLHIAAWVIPILAFIAYWNALGNRFVWDDMFLIVENEHIKSFRYIGHIFLEGLYRQFKYHAGYYRPIQALTYMLDYRVWGLIPFGYHLVNVVLQVFNSILVFRISDIIIRDRNKSIFVAAVFCVHPAFVPIVGYISGRADLLGMLFGLAVIYISLLYLNKGVGRKFLWLALICFTLAVMSKEYYIMALFFIALYMFIFRGCVRVDRAFKLFLGGASGIILIYVVLRTAIFNFYQVIDLKGQPFLDRLALFPYLIANYTATLLAPFNMSMEKRLTFSSFFEIKLLASDVLVFAMCYLAYHLYKKGKKAASFGLSWFLLSLLPLSNIFMPLKTPWADHWAYMPSLGLFIFCVLMASNGFSHFKKIGSGVKLCVSAAVIAMLITLTISENKYWSTQESLAKRISETSPWSAKGFNNLAAVALHKGDYAGAVGFLTKAIEVSHEKNPLYYFRRAETYKATGDIKRACMDYEAAVKLEPSSELYRLKLAAAYADLGMTEKARSERDGP